MSHSAEQNRKKAEAMAEAKHHHENMNVVGQKEREEKMEHGEKVDPEGNRRIY